MKKAFWILLVIVLITSCSTVHEVLSDVGFGGLAGFDKSSQKALDDVYLNLIESDNKDAIFSICEENNITVTYNDRTRSARFEVLGGPLSLVLYHDHIDFEFIETYSYEDILRGDGWFDPSLIKLESYGESITESIPYNAVETTNTRKYIQAYDEYVYHRWQDVHHVFSEKAKKFLFDNWKESDMYVTVIGRKTADYKLNAKEFGLMTLYRAFHEALFKYEYMKDASEAAIVKELTGLSALTAEEANQLVHYVTMNEMLSDSDVDLIKNMVNTKVSY